MKEENLENGQMPGGGDNPSTEGAKEEERMENKPTDAGEKGSGSS